ncbi:MAG: bifunctional adenosylcobinamide kinase/adenosylcobinamide-phosphate guanylyltransferase [Polaromonas sp.]|nr:MAG: bifunctional adenosylcobinamide kinase/adenosylcobinamide-phosphate guanylyltransferase [Polaromonas sp.]
MHNTIARSELILGGQRSGKSRRAEMLARDWLAQSPSHEAVLIATGQPWDDEMRARIARHQADRAERVHGMRTLEEPLALPEALGRCSNPHTLVVVDCLTLWLTNWLMPAEQVVSLKNEQNMPPPQSPVDFIATLATGPVILVGNEIGLGVIPMGRETRDFVDALGRLNQGVAARCARVTLMVAGLPLTLKEQP